MIEGVLFSEETSLSFPLKCNNIVEAKKDLLCFQANPHHFNTYTHSLSYTHT